MKAALQLISLIFIITVLFACTTDSSRHTHDTHPVTHDNEPKAIELSPTIKSLLTQEMRELQKGMKEVIPALVAGDWKTIANIGTSMQKSYIMKDSLTEEQMHEIHEALPMAFQELDHAFHKSAGSMANAAEKEDKDKVTYYYFRLTEACIECHSKYATDKFPQFIKPSP